MSNNPKHSWNENNIVDDVCFRQEDAEDFKALLTGNFGKSEADPADFTSGTILKDEL